MNNSRRVEIVIPVHNRKDITLQCLRSLERIDRTGFSVHTIVIDDGSTDGTANAISERFPDVEIVKGDGNLWYTGGTNLGIETALGHNPDYVLTLTDDSVFDDKFLLHLIHCCESNPRSVAGPLLLLWDEPHKIFQVAPKWDMWAGGFRHWRQQTVWTVPELPWEVELIVGNCMLFPADAIRECGLMNIKKFPHFGDAEYTPRMRKRGWNLLIEPRSRIFCQPNNLPPSVSKMPLKKLFRTLILDLGNANSMRRRFNGLWYGAPNRLKGVLAFPVFYLRYLFGRNVEGAYGDKLNEKPLAEIYADKVVRG